MPKLKKKELLNQKFIQAVTNNQTETALSLYKSGADINSKDSVGNTALCIASSMGYVEMVSALVERGADVNASRDDTTILHFIAALAGEHEDTECLIKIINILVTHDAQIDTVGPYGDTALHLAIGHGNPDIALALVKANASIMIKNASNLTPLDVTHKATQIEAVRTLIEYLHPTLTKFQELAKYSATVIDYQKFLNRAVKAQIEWATKNSTGSLFLTINSQERDINTILLKLLFKHQKRLNININHQLTLTDEQIQEHNISESNAWQNSALHELLANERFTFIPKLLNEAEKYNCFVDQNLIDRHGKTPFLLALKLGNTPLNLLSRLISSENYNLADRKGFTPAMVATSTRNIAALKLIFTKHLELNGLTINFDNLVETSPEAKDCLSAFINTQCYPITQKSLGHFAVLRTGTKKDMDKTTGCEPLTVLNILQSVSIDGRRDKNASSNGALCSARLRAPVLAGSPVEVTALNYADGKSFESALATKRNSAKLVKYEIEGCDPAFLLQQIASYSGIDYSTTLIQNTKATLTFLIDCGLELTCQQGNGKTVLDYINGLKTHFDNGNRLVTPEDILYIVEGALPILTQRKQHKPTLFQPAVLADGQAGESKAAPEKPYS